MLALSARVVQADKAVGESIPGDYLVLDLSTGRYVGVGEVGGFIWRLLDGGSDLAAIAAAVADHYGIDLERASEDVLELVADLLVRGVVVYA